MGLRNYSNTAVVTTETGLATGAGTTLTLASATGWPAAPFTAVVEPGTANAEVILIGARTGTACSAITRGYGATTAVTHASGSVIAHEVDATDLAEANAHVNASYAFEAFSGSASVVTGATVTTVVSFSATVPAGCVLAEAVLELSYSGTAQQTAFNIALGASAMSGDGLRWVSLPNGNTYGTARVSFLAAPPTGAQTLVIKSVASTAAVTATASIAGVLKYYK